MIVEASTIALIYGLYKKLSSKKNSYKNKLNQLYRRNKSFINPLGETPILLDHNETNFGTRLLLDIGKVMSFNDFLSEKDVLETYFKSKIEIEKLSNGDIQMDLITKDLFQKEYEPVKTEEFQLYCGLDKEFKPIISNMHYNTNALICGDIGTGKSSLLLAMLYNLLNSSNDNFFLLLVQLVKSDLTLLKNYHQVKEVITDMDHLQRRLLSLENIIKDRENAIKELSNLKIYDIKSYNAHFQDNKMKYIYLVIEEFSYLSVNKSDTKEVKEMKNSILNSLCKIVNVARAYGIILIIAIQKATSDTLDSRIKAQLRTRIAFRQDNTTSNVLMKSDTENLKNRECIVKLDNEITSIVPIFKIENYLT